MSFPDNPHKKDAGAAAAWVRSGLFPRKRYERDWPVEFIVACARWAGHWGNLALEQTEAPRP